MAGRARRTGGHRYPRSARVGETLREIIAEELVRIDDDRLELVTITGIDVDDELNRAHRLLRLAGGRGRRRRHHRGAEPSPRALQAAIADQIRARKTPVLDFRPDTTLREAERIDDILREDRKRHPDRQAATTETAETDLDGQA